MAARTLQIDLPDDAWRRIDALAAVIEHESRTVETVASMLLDIVQKGVDRPRSKEREFTIQCFGEEAVQEASL